MNPYTNSETIQRLLENIKAKGLDKKVYSDTVDEDGNQYVDLVQEGGGVSAPATMRGSAVHLILL
jgi:NTE family protein